MLDYQYAILKKMKRIIAVNTRFLIKGKLAGIGYVTLEILKRIVPQNPEIEFIFIFDRPFAPEFVFAPNITPLVVSPPARHPFLFYLWFEYSIPIALRKYKVDLFISPDNFLSLRLKFPTLLILHDLAFEHFPDDVSWIVRKYYHYFVPKFAHKAARICTVSEASRQDISVRYGIAPDKIDVIFVGPNSDIASSERQSDNQLFGKEAFEMKTRLTGNQSYFTSIGTVQPRKNLVRLLAAFEIYKQKTKSRAKLILIGKIGWKTKEIFSTFNNLKFKDDVIFAGRLDGHEIRWLLEGAIANVFVSYFEGFGMPVVEAQSAGCPVIASNRSSIPEAGGEAALYVDPFSVEEIAVALGRIEEDKSLRILLREKGFENATRFSWEKTADLLWNSVIKCLSNTDE
jgi:glycosyltransferase involved in cell wall biosynthesis